VASMTAADLEDVVSSHGVGDEVKNAARLLLK
jgi:hypothetical protein